MMRSIQSQRTEATRAQLVARMSKDERANGGLCQSEQEAIPATHRKKAVETALGAKVCIERGNAESSQSRRAVRLKDSKLGVDLRDGHCVAARIEIGKPLFHIPVLESLFGRAEKSFQDRAASDDPANPRGRDLVVSGYRKYDRAPAEQRDCTEQKIDATKQAFVERVPTTPIANVQLGFVFSAFVIRHPFLRIAAVVAALVNSALTAVSARVRGCAQAVRLHSLDDGHSSSRRLLTFVGMVGVAINILSEVAATYLRSSASPRMSDELMRQYERNTTKRPLLCFAALALMPFANELVCRILGAW